MSIDKDDIAKFRAKLAMHARCIEEAICAAQNELTDDLRTILMDSGSIFRASTMHVVHDEAEGFFVMVNGEGRSYRGLDEFLSDDEDVEDDE